MKNKTKHLTPALSPSAGADAERGKTPDEYRQIRRELLAPDPDQPRKTFSEASLDELALSIREQGIVQPLIVRLVPASYKLQEPDLHSKLWRVMERQVDGTWKLVCEDTEKECRAFMEENDGLRALEDHYQILAGERRWRASQPREIQTADGVVKWEGLAEVPCLVRDADARRKFALQFIENHQRENLSALEEATALEKQLQERRRTDAAFSPEQLGAELGLSRATMYERLKLTRLHGPVREALVAGKISTSVAAVVAIIPLPHQQEKLLKQITDEDDWQWPFSVRDVQEIVDDEYVKQLNDAPFDRKKVYAEAVLADGAPGAEPWFAPACGECPHRSGNLAAQFPDLAKRPNVCTRPDCFALKLKAHWKEKAQEEAQRGKTVLTETEFRKVKSQYVAGDRSEYAENRSGTFETLMGKHKPEPVLVATKEGLQRFYKKEEALAAARKNGVRFYSHRQETKTPEQIRKEKEEDERVAKLIQQRKALVLSLAPALAKGLAKLKEADVWALLKPHAKLCRWDPLGDAIQKRAPNDRAYVLCWVLDDALRGETDSDTGAWDKEFLTLTQKLGVDLEAEEKVRAAKPELALEAKSQPEQAQLLAVKPKGKSALARAKIAAAAKARWARLKAGAK